MGIPSKGKNDHPFPCCVSILRQTLLTSKVCPVPVAPSCQNLNESFEEAATTTNLHPAFGQHQKLNSASLRKVFWLKSAYSTPKGFEADAMRCQSCNQLPFHMGCTPESGEI